MRFFYFCLFSIFLVGCGATQPARIAQTPSSKPEVTINAPVQAIQDSLINEALNYNYTLETQTNSMLMLRRPLEGNEAFQGLLVGNSYSNNTRVLRYTFANTSSGVRVVMSQSLEAMMIGGQVNSVPITNNEVFNSNYQFLQNIKRELEAQ